jgi:hypothetical protein
LVGGYLKRRAEATFTSQVFPALSHRC